MFGAAAVDVTSQTRSAGSSSKLAATTYPGRVSVTLGGVARNMAETATRILSPFHSTKSLSPVKLISPHGVDDFGLLLRTGMQQAGMRTDGLFAVDGDQRTAVCSLMLDDSGDLISGVADMDIGQTALYPATYGDLTSLLEEERPKIVVFDGNIGSSQANELLSACEAYNRDKDEESKLLTLFEPTSVSKSTIILPHPSGSRGSKRQAISFATPNAVELEQIFATSVELGLVPPPAESPTTLMSSVPSEVLKPSTLAMARALVDAGIISTVLLKVGRHGVVTMDKGRIQHHPVPAGQIEVVNTTGCGDSFAGAFTATMSHLLSQNTEKTVERRRRAWYQMVDTAVEVGQLAARKTLASTNAVGEGIHLLLQARN